MAYIKPFRGIFYNKEIINNISLIIAPPYDVISPEEQERLYERSPYNIVRLIKGKDLPHDSESANSSTRANEYFNEWLKERVLIRDTDEAIYASWDEYNLEDGTKKIRKGFYALFKLEDFGDGGIFPHEETLVAPKEDRFRLMKACSANFSPIFSLYSDPERRINQLLKEKVWSGNPDIEILSQQRILHKLWRITNPLTLQEIIEAMKGQNVFIADGHHRYETALRYQKFLKQESGAKKDLQPYDYCLMYFTNTEDKGLTILPYHRVVKNLSPYLLDNIVQKLQEWFNVRAINFDGIRVTELMARRELVRFISKSGIDHPAFGMFKGNNKYYVLVLKSDVKIDEIVDGKGSKAWKTLDVNILHSLIFNKILGISSNDFEKQGTLVFVSDLTNALDLVNMRKSQAAFLVNPTRIEQVVNVALNREKMPQKSTFFFPKLPSGLVIRKID